MFRNNDLEEGKNERRKLCLLRFFSLSNSNSQLQKIKINMEFFDQFSYNLPNSLVMCAQAMRGKFYDQFVYIV